MPKIDGFELYEKIKEIDNKVLVWFITAYETYYRAIKEASSTSKKEMISVPVIEKPIEIDKLVKQIKTELDYVIGIAVITNILTTVLTDPFLFI
jgi:two-component system, OmpR family, response regulator ChvI